jgi:cytochrome c553
MTGIRMRRCAALAAFAAESMLVHAVSRASEEAVDRATQSALALDAHPGQRFAYLVRQLANFAGDERDSETMHRVVSQRELGGAQSWADIAAYLNRTPSLHRAQTGDGRRLALVD